MKLRPSLPVRTTSSTGIWSSNCFNTTRVSVVASPRIASAVFCQSLCLLTALLTRGGAYGRQGSRGSSRGCPSQVQSCPQTSGLPPPCGGKGSQERKAAQGRKRPSSQETLSRTSQSSPSTRVLGTSYKETEKVQQKATKTRLSTPQKKRPAKGSQANPAQAAVTGVEEPISGRVRLS